MIRALLQKILEWLSQEKRIERLEKRAKKLEAQEVLLDKEQQLLEKIERVQKKKVDNLFGGNKKW
jgi:hypothetical protein